MQNLISQYHPQNSETFFGTSCISTKVKVKPASFLKFWVKSQNCFDMACCAHAETCFPNIFQSFVLLDIIQKKTWGVCWTFLCGDFWLSVCIRDLKAHLDVRRLWWPSMWCSTLVQANDLCNRIDQMGTQWYVGVYMPSYTWLWWAKSFNISAPTQGFWYCSTHQWFWYRSTHPQILIMTYRIDGFNAIRNCWNEFWFLIKRGSGLYTFTQCRVIIYFNFHLLHHYCIIS